VAVAALVNRLVRYVEVTGARRPQPPPQEQG